ncbi:phosphoglycolate phosphatase [Hasllibacter halocynthiae]|uniref:Phosphoglycolate phosphatase n=1 Tax=Hasllibacter halocynthiae TaxID=595589 RepID=A0A2T0X3K5_9RHOB|nr:HAD hydrolase-like protein [Hasllibacter halocynthiae]PRY93511.1 phosphoglycolate phosphatase [Hasllibacter halocynthiae]
MKLLLLDVDGTLVDSQGHIQAAMEAAFAARGLPAPDREGVRGIIGLSLPVAMARLAPGADAEALTRAYGEAFHATRDDPAARSPLYPGAGEAVEALLARDDLLLGIATGKSRRGLDHVLEAHGLRGRFHTEQVADHHPSKPHPSMVWTALAETGVEGGDAALLGGSPYDMEMARLGGIRALGALWGYGAPEALRRAGAHRLLAGWDEIAGEPA